MKAWRQFVLDHGFRALRRDLAFILGRSEADIDSVRATHACSRGKPKRFAELFTLHHGRPPRDDEWPAPSKSRAGRYEWQAPEVALLARLVGRMGHHQIAKILTKRLRKITSDPKAERGSVGVLVRMNQIGLQTGDVVGGITIKQAGAESGAYYIVWNAVKRKQLPAFRVGRLWVIPREAWEKWKSKRVFPPPGYVQLSKLKRPLGIKSDKLSEWARMGYVPTALRCNPYGLRSRSTKFGTWFMDPKVAAQLVADRRAGKPMPWWGKPEPCNLGVTYKLWKSRQHPASCATCQTIWGGAAPYTFDDYLRRYPALLHGAKRHLTMPWSPGLSLDKVAKLTGHSWSGVRLAITNGQIIATKAGRAYYVSRTEVTRWKSRGCRIGSNDKSWISLHFARRLYMFTLVELEGFITSGKLKSKVGTFGAMRGITYVPRVQCMRLRETIGFTESEAARRVGISVPRFRRLLNGANWRGAVGIPLDTIRAVQRRVHSQDGGCDIEEAARRLGVTVDWIHERKLDGTIRISRAKFDRRRIYITMPMMKRLKEAKRKPPPPVEQLDPDMLYLTQAADEAGVSTGTILQWADAGEVRRVSSHLGFRYPRKSIRARARTYWPNVRFKRATPPAWLAAQ